MMICPPLDPEIEIQNKFFSTIIGLQPKWFNQEKKTVLQLTVLQLTVMTVPLVTVMIVPLVTVMIVLQTTVLQTTVQRTLQTAFFATIFCDY